MSIKKSLIMGVASAALGLSLVGGGTYAYFSDTEVTSNTFAAGTLDLAANPTTIVDVDSLKPGDSVTRTFNLENNGTLDIEHVLLDTAYKVNDAGGDNGSEDFGKHIEVEFLYNINNLHEVIYKTTLADLKKMTPEAVDQHVFYPWLGEKGLPSGSSHELLVKFNFVDNGKDQNVFQGDSLALEWTFEARQTDGEVK
ncbi:CalY family protein [Metabacillus arenae]|uniref:M73 family metallopeptidase n=1 Tax=Metabacillus arenae TaxID=2771434 RepID=A0A926NKL4_9BACI|nr:CalY family protein [Metabacillus arenae]MBD1382333.1 M73 family metallopeptidase [Metabacillus arenae]